MSFKLRKALYDLLINISGVKDYINYLVEYENFIEFEINKVDFREVQLLINDEIVFNGMDNQEKVNNLGIKLYKLYDELLYQKNNQ